jgi:HK97 gp10 family phage protein
MYTSYLTSVINDLGKGQEKALDKAAIYLVKKLKEKLGHRGLVGPDTTPHKRTGNLQKGMMFDKVIDGSRRVGAGPPASRAHLLEFGTGPRIVKNFYGHKGVTKDIGPLRPHPFMVPTFEEEAENVENILTENWI